MVNLPPLGRLTPTTNKMNEQTSDNLVSGGAAVCVEWREMSQPYGEPALMDTRLESCFNSLTCFNLKLKTVYSLKVVK